MCSYSTRRFTTRSDWNPSLDHAVVHLEVGALFTGIFGGLWHGPDADKLRRRETLAGIVLAAATALIANRALSMAVPLRVWPMFSVGANAPTFDWHADLEHWSSFPSDNATFLRGVVSGAGPAGPLQLTPVCAAARAEVGPKRRRGAVETGGAGTLLPRQPMLLICVNTTSGRRRIDLSTGRR